MKVLQFLKLEEGDSIINSLPLLVAVASVNCTFCCHYGLSKHSVHEGSILFSCKFFIKTALKPFREREGGIQSFVEKNLINRILK